MINLVLIPISTPKIKLSILFSSDLLDRQHNIKALTECRGMADNSLASDDRFLEIEIKGRRKINNHNASGAV